MFPFRTVGLLPASWFFEGFLGLTEDPLDLPGSGFHRALDLQARTIRQLARFRSDAAFYFVKLADGLVSRTWFDRVFSLDRIQGSSPGAIHRRKCIRPIDRADDATTAASFLPTMIVFPAIPGQKLLRVSRLHYL